VNSYRDRAFKKLFALLPLHVQEQAQVSFKLFKNDPYYSSLHFKCINQGKQMYSIRIGGGYRAVGRKENTTIIWYWIGSHADYDHL
jgi:hypothetical protein